MKRLLALVLVFLLAISFISCAKSSQTNSLDEYLIPDVPMAYTEFLVFPKKESLDTCFVKQYQSASLSTLFFDDIYFMLNCVYTGEQYEQETLRLEKVGAEYHEDLFDFPAYVMLFYADYYEYALLDTQNNSVIYIAAKISDFRENSSLEILNDFPPQFLPTHLPENEICKYN